LARTRYTKLYLHSSHANGPNSDGTLELSSARTESPDQFAYDPNKPVPTIGGRMCCGSWLPAGPFDQRPNESRSDVLVFSTPALTDDLEVTGFVSLELFAATSAIDTDFTALLADVDPSGYARFLTDGIVRARYRDSKPEPVTPGNVYKYNIDLWATGNVFKKGHRIRLYISSSNFPRFSRNLNTGLEASSKPIVARQTIYHDDQHRSALILPVIPKE
jgi:putative CocE/NonD family hydrolase